MQNLLPHDGEAYLYREAFNQKESTALFRALKNNIAWRQDEIKMFGKFIKQPRLTAWYGDTYLKYTYSGLTLHASPWLNELLAIKQKIESIDDNQYNSCLLNLYRDGEDYMGWHQDNEKELGNNPAIASISFGATRTFQLYYKDQPQTKVALELDTGSVLIMKGNTQTFWKHRIPKQKRITESRINLTFRYIYQ